MIVRQSRYVVTYCCEY